MQTLLSRLLIFILLSLPAFATSAVSGRLIQPDTTAPGQSSEVHLDLQNCGGNYPIASGSSVTTHQVFQLSTVDGTWAGTLYRNDEISCNGSYTTWWHLTYWVNGRQVGPARDYVCSQASCTFDSMTPLTVYPAPAPPQPPVSGARTFTFNQPTTASTWTMAHNFAITDVIPSFYDLTGKQIYPDTVTETDSNTLTATFLTAQAGRALIINAGNFTPTTVNPNYIVSNPTSAQSIAGGFDFSLKGRLLPMDSNLWDLGSNTLQWRDGLFARNVNVGGSLLSSKLNGTFVLDGSTYTTLSGVVGACGSAGCEVYVPQGTTAPTAQITMANPVSVYGAGINSTIIQPTGALASSLFNVTETSEGLKFSDLTIDMTNAGARNVFDLNGPTRPVFENVRIIYPAGAAGKAFNITNAAEPHFRNIMVRNGGYCFDYNGDNASEAFFSDIACESQTTAGFRITRTTATDIGGFYLNHVKITNPGNQSANQSFVLTSTIANSVTPFFCSDCVGDNALGGSAFSATNINLVYFGGDTWFTTGAGNAAGAVALNGVTDFIYTGGHIQSSATGADIALTGTNGSLNLANVQLRGSNKSITASGSTLSNYQQANISFNVNPAAADEAVLAGAAPSQIFRYGTWFGTRNDQGQAQEFCWVNKTTGGAANKKCARVSQTGSLEILNDANSTVISSLADAGNLSVPGTMQWGGGSTISNSNTTGTGTLVAQTSPSITTPTFNTSVTNSGSGFKHATTASGICSTTATAGNICTFTLSWSGSFADTSYTAQCNAVGTLTGQPLVFVSARLVGSVTVGIQAQSAVAATVQEVDCIGIHP